MGAPKPVELIRGVGAPSWEPWGVGTPKSGGAVTPKPGDRALGMGAAKPGGGLGREPPHEGFLYHRLDRNETKTKM